MASLLLDLGLQSARLSDGDLRVFSGHSPFYRGCDLKLGVLLLSAVSQEVQAPCSP